MEARSDLRCFGLKMSNIRSTGRVSFAGWGEEERVGCILLHTIDCDSVRWVLQSAAGNTPTEGQLPRRV